MKKLRPILGFSLLVVALSSTAHATCFGPGGMRVSYSTGWHGGHGYGHGHRYGYGHGHGYPAPYCYPARVFGPPSFGFSYSSFGPSYGVGFSYSNWAGPRPYPYYGGYGYGYGVSYTTTTYRSSRPVRVSQPSVAATPVQLSDARSAQQLQAIFGDHATSLGR